jgi:O-antigen/teichoic acid export membrane protein
LRSNSDVVLIGSLASPIEVAVYSVAKRVSNPSRWASVSINAAVSPVFSRYHDAGRMKGLKQLLRQASIGSALVALPIVLGLALLGPWIFPLFSHELDRSYGPMLVLLVGQYISACAGPVGSVMVMTGHEREVMLTQGATIVLSLALTILLVPLYGAYGAAIGLAASQVLANVILTLRVKVVFRRSEASRATATKSVPPDMDD